jgi:peptide/nickel transport system ATP-binding protein
MIFQEPMSSFSPLYTIGNQIGEVVQLHRKVSKKEARDITAGLLDKVGIPDAWTAVDRYPHEYSGGMRQRAMIAKALSCDPALLIADEPTTALDVTIQAQIVELMQELQQEFHMAIIFITHDLGVVAQWSSAGRSGISFTKPGTPIRATCFTPCRVWATWRRSS